ncbi:MAG TPA: beta-ketoacyl-[acyl-carrier-protein] synthase family protein [Burkholderiales bacterium]|nr:beta-ketoacyl-[acyl-carrier-protein] synthase family protein [Burkholderiales bacterium]
MNPLVFSRIAIASSAAIGIDATVTALRARRTGLAPCEFETAQLQTCVGQVADANLLPVRGDLAEFDCRNNRLAQLGLTQDGFEEAVLEARERYGAGRIGVFLGTSTSGIHSTELAYRRRDAGSGALPADFHYGATHNTYSVAWFVQSYLGLRGPSLVVSTACSSSAKVFGTAARTIAAGLCDAAVVGGVDSLCLTTLYGFGSLGLLSTGYCRPFDSGRDGISIGEGAGFILLEKPAANSPSNAVALLGVGESSDAYHMSSPHPEGLGARLAMESALRDAGLAPGAIDYINLHGTGTPANDAMEDKAVVDLFGRQTRCSSTKGWTGHTLGACGAIEAIISVLAIENGFLPGSVNTRDVDPAMSLRYMLENEPASANRAMSNAFGFGGTNCSLVLGRA